MYNLIKLVYQMTIIRAHVKKTPSAHEQVILDKHRQFANCYPLLFCPLFLVSCNIVDTIDKLLLTLCPT